jgi:RNA polymerase sigma factor (sigma-70 family)
MGLLIAQGRTDATSPAESFSFTNVPRLTTAMRHGEEAAFAWLHEQWSQRINRYCFALAAGDEVFAGEIAQAAWLRIVKYIRPLEDEQILWNWIACAARHAASDLRRMGGRYLRVLGRFAQWVIQPVHRGGNKSDADEGLLSALDAALLFLSEDEHALVEGRYFRAETLEVIASQHQISVRAVEGRLARLRKRLRELITEQLKQRHP